ncbi:MAG: N-acetylmuramoyl-L-alanine amidase [Lachnospiraceae bacterium]|nr:N-acetylmuramoyl-L-alanine amidase [Lachnospiraceae bacterium]
MQKRKRFQITLLLLSACFGIWFACDCKAYADNEVVVVIDPGHGGENLGAQYDGYTEKDMTMVVAKAMQEELQKFENITVYLTHDTDVDMSLKERAKFAQEKNADFLFSIHFNASVNHNLFGAEVWIPAYADFYVKGYQFAEIQMAEFESMGLYSRGIKTKLNDIGEDYYGILRHCSSMGIPSALLEHCHLDQENDKLFYQHSEEQWKEFGKRDAEAVAKYFGLKSESKGVDYSNYEKVSVSMPKGAVKPDKSAPEVSEIEVLSVDEETAEITVKMTATDSDGYIQYYKYSFDGGLTYSDLQKWPRTVWNHSEPEHTFKVTAPFDREIDLRLCAYNGFDVWTESNCITLEAIAAPVIEEVPAPQKQEYREISYEPYAETEEISMPMGETVKLIVLIVLISLLIAVILFAMIAMLLKARPRNKRRRAE